jgi:1-deoxy-D-xylulose-5-phosphate reductoisomerase
VQPTASVISAPTCQEYCDTPINLSILGATGSVGQSTLDVVAAAPPGKFSIEALTAHTNVDALAAAARSHNAKIAVIADPRFYKELHSALAGTGIEAAAGPSGLDEAADRSVDCVMAAIVGAAGLRPALAVAKRAKRLAIANKECMVIAGQLFMEAMSDAGTEIIPVDSEHAAVFQVLENRDTSTVSRVLLTASGGPFRDWPPERMMSITRQDALKHPNWSMGDKITIDSATMMNKGLELIEAFHLFGLESSQFDALIHPQSIVHSLVEFCDGSILAQMGAPDMRTPIAQSLYWPDRRNDCSLAFDIMKLSSLTFESIDLQKFPAFGLAQAAMARGGAAPAVLNGANEMAVSAFLNGSIHFLDIATTVAKTLDKAEQLGLFTACMNIEDALQVDAEARELARDVMTKLS